jgi:hypothetical protein
MSKQICEIFNKKQVQLLKKLVYLLGLVSV